MKAGAAGGLGQLAHLGVDVMAQLRVSAGRAAPGESMASMRSASPGSCTSACWGDSATSSTSEAPRAPLVAHQPDFQIGVAVDPGHLDDGAADGKPHCGIGSPASARIAAKCSSTVRNDPADGVRWYRQGFEQAVGSDG